MSKYCRSNCSSLENRNLKTKKKYLKTKTKPVFGQCFSCTVHVKNLDDVDDDKDVKELNKPNLWNLTSSCYKSIHFFVVNRIRTKLKTPLKILMKNYCVFTFRGLLYV